MSSRERFEGNFLGQRMRRPTSKLTCPIDNVRFGGLSKNTRGVFNARVPKGYCSRLHLYTTVLYPAIAQYEVELELYFKWGDKLHNLVLLCQLLQRRQV